MRYSIKIAVFIAILGFAPTLAEAQTAAISNARINENQYFYQITAASGVEYFATQEIGTGRSHTITEIGAYPFGNFALGSVQYFRASIQCYLDSGYTISCGSSATSTDAQPVGVSTIQTVSALPTPYTLDPDNYYKITFGFRKSSGGNTDLFFLGNPFSLVTAFPTGAANSNWPNTLPTVSSIPFTLYTAGSADGVTPTGPGALVEFNPVQFTGLYNNCDTRNYTLVQFIISRVLTGDTIQATAPAAQCGAGNSYSLSLSLPNAGEYTYRARLVSDPGATFSTSLTASSTFMLADSSVIGGDPGSIGDIDWSNLGTTTGLLSTSTALNVSCDTSSNAFAESFCNLFQFLFTPDSGYYASIQANFTLLKEKPPLGYFWLIDDAWSTATTSATSSTYLIGASALPQLFDPIKIMTSVMIGALMLLYMWKRFTRWEFQT